MIGFITVIHVIACTLLIIMILIQRGRGSGLVEAFSGVESMFGTKTSAFLARTTTVLSIIFFLTCLSLAILSARQSRSLMQDLTVPVVNEMVPTVDVKPAAVDAKPAAVDAKAVAVDEKAPAVVDVKAAPKEEVIPSPKPQEAPKAE
jgi:preprotein translocase subunit SecG